MSPHSIPVRLKQIAHNHNDNVAIRFLRQGSLETELSFEQLQLEIQQLSQDFRRCGIIAGSRVVIFIDKCVFAVIAHFAVLTAGAISVPLNPGFTRNEMTYLLNDAAPDLIITDPEHTQLVEEIYPQSVLYTTPAKSAYQCHSQKNQPLQSYDPIDISPRDPALIIYTSGTTGNPKGAVLTHKNLLNDAENIRNVWQINHHDIICHALPLFHVHGLCFALQTPLLAGACIHLLDTFVPEHVIEELSRKTEPVNSVFMAVPAMYTKILDTLNNSPPDFSHLRLITSGSAPLPVKEFKRITEYFAQEPVEREGMSETGMNFSNPLTGKKIPGSIGVPLPGLKIRIVNPDTLQDVLPGETGELLLKSDSIASSYWRKPDETEAAFHQGWFRTGDLCYSDDNGYYYLTDRIKHIIISGGENISAKEVEAVIDMLEGVAESVVVGKPDDKWGEIVVAAVCLQTGFRLSEDAVRIHCKQHLHAWKCPKKVLFVDDIPRNTMGKVLKEVVRQWF